MTNLKYFKAIPISLKEQPEFNEAWVRNLIVDDPAILGLGDLIVRDVERRHAKAGRLDLLLSDREAGKRYEVELMLGPTDESHIIRTIEYWDIERRRYPQYDHCAVIVAEKLTSRFLNVINLLNGAIPLVAIQLNALRVGEHIVLNFTKVLDELALGLVDEDEPVSTPTDRAFWEKLGSKETVKLADECLGILQEISPGLALKYNKSYIGLVENSKPNNFVVFYAYRHILRVESRIDDWDTWAAKLEDAGIVALRGAKSQGWLNFRLKAEEIESNHDLLRDLFKVASEVQ